MPSKMKGRTRSGEKFTVLVAIVLFLGLVLRLAQNLESNWTAVNVLSFQVAFFMLLAAASYIPLTRGLRTSREGRVPPLDDQSANSILASGHGRPTAALSLGSAYVISLTLAFWYLWNSLHVPSPPFYFWFTIAFTLVGLQILVMPRFDRRSARLVLLEIVLLALLIRLAYPLLNPTSIFSDTYFHWLGMQTIAAEAWIPGFLGHYLYFPSYAVLGAIALMVGDLGPQEHLLLNHLLLALAPVATYLLARCIASTRVALMASLLLCASVFFILQTQVGPIFLGIIAIIFSLYALLRFRQDPKWRWWVVLWTSATLVFFTHPVNALILAAILGAYWANGRLHPAEATGTKLVSPTTTYWVAYLGYLSLIAFRTFSLFLQSLFESGPTYYLARATVDPESPPNSFLIQMMTSTFGFTILFLPAGLTLLYWLFRGNWEQRLIVGALLTIALVPAVMVIGGRGHYGLQAVRTLPYLSSLLVLPASYGIVRLVRSGRHKSHRAIVAVAFLLLVALFSGTSYLTGSGNRYLTETIPVRTAYATDSVMATRSFLLLIPPSSTLALDPVLAHFLAPHGSGITYPYTPYPVPHESVVRLSTGLQERSAILFISDLYLEQQGYQRVSLEGLDDRFTIRAYDSGVVLGFVPVS